MKAGTSWRKSLRPRSAQGVAGPAVIGGPAQTNLRALGPKPRNLNKARSLFTPLMSGVGQKRTSLRICLMSALAPKADILACPLCPIKGHSNPQDATPFEACSRNRKNHTARRLALAPNIDNFGPRKSKSSASATRTASVTWICPARPWLAFGAPITKNITGELAPARYVPSAAIFAGNQDHIGARAHRPIAASTSSPICLGDPHVQQNCP